MSQHIPPSLPPEPEDPGLERLFERIEEALRREPLLPLPLHLVPRILARVGERRVSTLGALARLAAAVIVGIGAWFAVSSGAPALADVTLAPPLERVVPADAVPSLAALGRMPETSLAVSLPGAGGSAGAALMGLAGAGLVGVGLLLARRWRAGGGSDVA